MADETSATIAHAVRAMSRATSHSLDARRGATTVAYEPPKRISTRTIQMTNTTGAIAPPEKAKTTAQLIAELNAELRGKDPNENLRRQIRMATLDEFETRAKADAPATARAPFGPPILRLLADMRAGR